MATPSYDLVILAAGMGSRFSGLKQMQPIGPHGELIIEYSAFDALRAGGANGFGFGRLVLVIRKENEIEFRAAIGRRLESRMDVHYVFQEFMALPAGFAAPVGRTKPWGTSHAVLAAQPAVRGPFAVINADDFYGASGYRNLTAYFQSTVASPKPSYAMVGYPLKQTLSEHGAVSRGLCATDEQGRLQRITEITKIEKKPGGARYTDAEAHVHLLTGEEIVSMNFWGFTPAVFPQLERLFGEFLTRHGRDPKSECYLPSALSTINERGAAEIALLPSEDPWFGLTYREDIVAARAAISEFIAAGKYPSPLWG